MTLLVVQIRSYEMIITHRGRGHYHVQVPVPENGLCLGRFDINKYWGDKYWILSANCGHTIAKSESKDELIQMVSSWTPKQALKLSKSRKIK